MRCATTFGILLTVTTGRVSPCALNEFELHFHHLAIFNILIFPLPHLATIENFNVVETLSDNAAIIYQTHKVRDTKR